LKFIRFIIVLFIILIAQVTLVDIVSFKGYRPDLILLFLLFRLPKKGTYRPILIGFGVGLLQDLVGGGFLGVNALAKSVLGFLIGKFFPEKVPANQWVFFYQGIICILAHDLVYHYIYGQVAYLGFFNFLWRQVLPSSLLNILLLFILILVPQKRKRYS
jgi:rod shape-determining protein MreD